MIDDAFKLVIAQLSVNSFAPERSNQENSVKVWKGPTIRGMLFLRSRCNDITMNKIFEKIFKIEV